MAAVPDTTTFSLQDVVDVVAPTTNDLVDCFADADSNMYDSAYSQSKNQLDDFRNYDNAYSYAWGGYIVWSFDYDGGFTFYFIAQNVSTGRYGQSSQMYWESQLADVQVSTGNVSSGSLDPSGVSYPSDAHSGNPYDEIEGFVSGSPIQILYP